MDRRFFSLGQLYPASVEFGRFQLDAGRIYEVQGETLFSDKEYEGHHLVVFREIFPKQDKYNQARIFEKVPPKKFVARKVQGKISYLPAERVF